MPEWCVASSSFTQPANETDRTDYLLASGSLGTGMSHPLDCNVYGVDCGDEFVLVDAGVGPSAQVIIDHLVADGIQPERVRRLLLTHGHLDHSGGSRYLRDTLKLRVCASPETAEALEIGDTEAISLDKAKAAGGYPPDFPFQSCPVDQRLTSGEKIFFPEGDCEVLATPGHSHEMLSYILRTRDSVSLFSGDTLFMGVESCFRNL